MITLVQAQPMFNDRRKLSKLADPNLQGRYPTRGLYQALAVASMCIQEEAATRPLIADVVTALSYLATQSYDSSTAPTSGHRSTRAGRLPVEKPENDNGQRLEAYGSERDDSPREGVPLNNKDFDREKAIAEAKMWGANWREKRRASDRGSFDAANGNG